MTKYPLTFSETEQLENELEFERDKEQQARIIDQLISNYAYTNINLANEYLVRQYPVSYTHLTLPTKRIV